MSSLDGVDLFGSGPHGFATLAWERSQVRRGFAGVDGEMVVDMGLRSRRIVQTGRLCAPTAEALDAIVNEIELWQDGRLHQLIDNLGRTYPRVMMEGFALDGPPKCGRGFWCEYTVNYLQFP
jgi:hypothetical protein